MMLKKPFKIFVYFVSVICLISIAFACAGPAATSLPEPSYAKAITENVLNGINSGDYIQFSKDFDVSMKQAMTQQSFEQIKSTLANKIGSYVPNSLEFSQAVTQSKYTVVIYSAKFTNETDKVIITISFQNIGGQDLVGGLYFNSPKLRS